MKNHDLALGIDIGGTHTSMGYVDREGRMILSSTMPTHPEDSAEKFIARLHEEIEELRKGLTAYRWIGIGIGVPNVHALRGTVERPVNLNWDETVDLAALIRQYYDMPVFVTNDANAAAVGEAVFGNARGMKHFIVVTIGTGLGSGIVVGGKLLDGASGFAGELGHTVVNPSGRMCRCGNRGCLETYVSAAGLVRTAAALIAKRCDPSPLRSISFEALTAKKIFELANTGDALSLEAFDLTARILGMKLADAVALLSPEAIFLTGGLSAAGDLLIQPAEKYMNDFLFHAYRGTVSLMPSGMEPGTGAVLGAAALVFSGLPPASTSVPEKISV